MVTEKAMPKTPTAIVIRMIPAIVSLVADLISVTTRCSLTFRISCRSRAWVALCSDA
jgi:hypothetical protein